MRKWDWPAWVFFFAVTGLVVFQFSWFKTQYLWAFRWVQSDPHYLYLALFLGGLIFGWLFASMQWQRSLKRVMAEHTNVLATQEQANASNLFLRNRNAELRSELRDLNNRRQAEGRLTRVPRGPTEIAHSPANPTAKKSNSRKKVAEKTEKVSGRVWQEQLLDDGFDRKEPEDGLRKTQ